ncbi:transposase family protein [Paenibacillus amylolyticus]
MCPRCGNTSGKVREGKRQRQIRHHLLFQRV